MKRILLTIPLLIVTACGTQKTGPDPVATFNIENNHTISFYVTPDGPAGISDAAPSASEPSWVMGALRTNRISDIYRTLAGPSAVVPDALIEAENRTTLVTNQSIPSAVPLQSVGDGPQFYTSAEQSSFKSSYCASGNGWECVQGWNWATSSYGQASTDLSGYQINALNGSEATAHRLAEIDYWTGSSWASCNTYSLAPGWHVWMSCGSLQSNGNCTASNNPHWEFKSELANGGGAQAQVSLADDGVPCWVDTYGDAGGVQAGGSGCGDCPASCMGMCNYNVSTRQCGC